MWGGGYFKTNVGFFRGPNNEHMFGGSSHCCLVVSTPKKGIDQIMTPNLVEHKKTYVESANQNLIQYHRVDMN